MQEISATVFVYILKLIDSEGCEQSWWMKGICLIWSRGRHFSPSLPDRGPTQGWGPTGIWHLTHSISDPRAEISGILVMVRALGPPLEVLLTGSSCLHFLASKVFRLLMRKFSEIIIKKKMRETTNCFPGSTFLFLLEEKASTSRRC